MKYRVYKSGNKIIAVSSFAGKLVRGVAKCDPMDNFNEEIGTDLAKARCNLKVAEKRAKRAWEKYMESLKNLANAQDFCDKMKAYSEDAEFMKAQAKEYLELTVNKLTENA